jgi:DNA modification methylase
MDAWLNRCHFGDVRAVLRRMIDDGVQVHTIVTSPPYWGLRSYLPAGHPDKAFEIGSEPTIGEFITGMVEVFDLARQVLRDDGTMWVNMGDSYANDGKWGGLTGGKQAYLGDENRKRVGREKRTTGLPPKSLVGQPWRLAFALQDAGWILRQEIIWNKPNPMPESIRDRCTKAYESLFLLAKSEQYYFDQEAISEPVSENTHARLSQNVEAQIGSARANGGAKSNGNMKAVGRRDAPVQDSRKQAERAVAGKSNPSFLAAMALQVTRRNKRSVWTIATESYSGAHFATFPRKLIEPCILAGSPVGGTVLDIFFGSGTTGQVAQALGRDYIGIDLNSANEPLQRERLRQPSLLLEAA